MKDVQDFVDRANRYITEREKFDPEAVYAQLKDVYPLSVTWEPARDDKIPVLHGESSAGRFELWDNGLDILFEIYTPDGAYTHWHPSDTAEAIQGIHSFMNGIREHRV